MGGCNCWFYLWEASQRRTRERETRLKQQEKEKQKQLNQQDRETEHMATPLLAEQELVQCQSDKTAMSVVGE
jgi:hypothetical protein